MKEKVPTSPEVEEFVQKSLDESAEAYRRLTGHTRAPMIGDTVHYLPHNFPGIVKPAIICLLGGCWQADLYVIDMEGENYVQRDVVFSKTPAYGCWSWPS